MGLLTINPPNRPRTFRGTGIVLCFAGWRRARQEPEMPCAGYRFPYPDGMDQPREIELVFAPPRRRAATTSTRPTYPACTPSVTPWTRRPPTPRRRWSSTSRGYAKMAARSPRCDPSQVPGPRVSDGLPVLSGQRLVKALERAGWESHANAGVTYG